MATQPGWAQPPDQSEDTTVLLVRHGETVWNREGRVQGHRDSPLSELGLEQGLRVACRLASHRLDAVYSSDSLRALETARLVAEKHGLPVAVREDLRERCYGALEGKTLDEACRSEGAWLARWQADRRDAPLAGESQDHMQARVVAALWEIVAAHAGRTIALCTHGGPIKSALYEILSIPTSLWRRTWIENGSLTVFRGTPGLLRVATFNDICHLAGMAGKSHEVEG